MNDLISKIPCVSESEVLKPEEIDSLIRKSTCDFVFYGNQEPLETDSEELISEELNFDFASFLEEEEMPELKVINDDSSSWKILIVDDDEDIHNITRLTLRTFKHKNKSLKLLSAYSAREAREVLLLHPDISIILLDVVMETPDAGLRLVKTIRNELKNSKIRIVIRTGQPGYAPEREIMQNYDIDDYRNKTDIDRNTLFTILTSGLRSYESLLTVENYNRKLQEEVQKRTKQLKESKNHFKILLEETLSGVVSLLWNVLSELAPRVSDRVIKLKSLAEKIALEMNFQPFWQLEIATILSELSCILLPKELLEKKKLSLIEQEILSTIPLNSSKLLENIPFFENITKAIANLQNNCKLFLKESKDNRGFDSLSQILALSKVYLNYHDNGYESEKIIFIIRQKYNFDQVVITALKKQLVKVKPEYKLKVAKIFSIPDNSLIAEDIYDNNNKLLITRGHLITKIIKFRLINWYRLGRLNEKIKILVPE